MKSNKKLRVAVYGSAKTSKENIAVAQELGEWLAGLDCFLITGATTGISEAVVKGFNNKDSVGYSPTRNEIEAKRFETIYFDNLGSVIHTGIIFDKFLSDNLVIDSEEARFKFRNFLTAAICDVAICMDGGFGTFTEAVLVLGMDKTVIVLEGSGGVSDKLLSILGILGLKKEKLVVVNNIDEVISYLKKLV